MTIHIAIAIGLLLYVVTTTAVSFLLMSRVKKPADYLVAGRGLPFWVLAGTIVGTCIGTGVIIGGTGLAYKHGWAGCAYPIGLGVGTLLTGLLFAKTRRYGFMTLSEEIACYYSNNRIVVEFSNITLFLSQLCWLTVQILGGGAVLGAVTSLPHHTCILIAGFTKAIISIPGGMKAVVYTDVLQTVILFSGFGFLLYTALGDVGGLGGLQQSVPPDYFTFLGIDSMGRSAIVGLLAVLILNPLVDPSRRLTIYSAKSERSALWSMVGSGLIVIGFSVAIGIVGMYTFHLNPKLPVPDEAMPWLVMNKLPPWLAAFVVVAIVSGMSSAANGNAAAAGTFFVRHIFPLVTGRYPQNPVTMARRALTVVFALSTCLAIFTNNIVGFVVKFLPLTMSGLVVIILLARFWPRATWQGAMAGLIVTPVVSLVVMLVPGQTELWGNPILPASLAGLIAHLLVSLRTPPPEKSFDEVAEILRRDRQGIEAPH
jgi:SSS family solute:Na+ symporter